MPTCDSWMSDYASFCNAIAICLLQIFFEFDENSRKNSIKQKVQKRLEDQEEAFVKYLLII